MLFEALQHDREGVLEALLSRLQSMELPSLLDERDASLRLYQALCMTRVLSSCLFHEWLTYQMDDILSRPFVTWKDPMRLNPTCVTQIVQTVSKHFDKLLAYQQSMLSARVGEQSSNSSELDKLRSLVFMLRDSDNSVRELDCLYAMLDAHHGVHTASAAQDAYFVLDAHFPPLRAPIRLFSHGITYTATMWRTPADATDAPVYTIAAYLYRELAYLMLYASSCNWDMTIQLIGSITDPNTNLRLYECVHWQWPQLDSFLRSVLRDLPHVPRTSFTAVAVMLRRVIHMWTHFHTDERHEVFVHGMPESVSRLFDALYSMADSHRKRIVLWPTLGVLLGLAPVPYAPVRMRRETHSKRWAFTDALHHNLSHSRLGPPAWFSTVILHSVCDLDGAPVPTALTSAACTCLLENLHTFAADDTRLGGLFLASLVRLEHMDAVMNIIHTCLYDRPTMPGILVVIHAIILLIVRDIGSWRAKLFPPCAPVLRRTFRQYIRSWIADGRLDSMSSKVLHGIMYLALLDPMSILTLIPNNTIDAQQVPISPSPTQLDALLQIDSRVSLVLAFLHLPASCLNLHAASLAALKRLSGGKPVLHVLCRFPYVPSTVLETYKNNLPDSARIHQLLGNVDIEYARNAAQRVLAADDDRLQLYWLVVMQTSLARIQRLHLKTECCVGSMAVLYGMFMPQIVNVHTAVDVANLLQSVYVLPDPLPRLVQARLDLTTLCNILRATKPPNVQMSVAWSALLRQWIHTLPEHGKNAAMYMSQLTHIAYVLAAGAHVGLHGQPLNGDTPYVSTITDMFLHYPALHDLAIVLLEPMPLEILPHMIDVAFAGIPRAKSQPVWLKLLNLLVPRMHADFPSTTTMRKLVEMLLVCANSATTNETRLSVCKVTAMMFTCERHELMHSRAELIDRILPWTLTHTDDNLRQKALECIVLVSKYLTDDIPPMVLRMHVSPQSALFRRTARIVSRLIRAASLDKPMDAGVHDVAFGREPSLAVVALEQVLRQNLDFFSHEAVTLTTSPLSSARIAIMLAVARLFSHPEFIQLEQETESLPVETPDVLFADEGRWIAKMICTGTIQQAHLYEKVLNGVMTQQKMRTILVTVLQIEIEACTGDSLWVRSNSSALAFVTACARRSAHVHIQRFVQNLVKVVSLLPPEGLDFEGAAHSEEMQQARNAEALHLITLLGEGLIEFVRMFPAELHKISTNLYELVKSRFGVDNALFSLGTFLCLRVLGPAIAAPDSVAVALPPGDAARRALLFLNKVLVALPQGGFPSHREPTLVALNGVVSEHNVILRRTLQEIGQHGEPSFILDVTSNPLPRLFYRPLRACMEPLAKDGDANAAAVLSTLPAQPTLRERYALVLNGQAPQVAYDSFMSTYCMSDTRVASEICIVNEGTERSSICLMYSHFDQICADFAAIAYYIFDMTSKFTKPWDFVFDMTGATERKLFQIQYIAFISALFPSKTFRLLNSVVVVNASFVALRHGWLINEDPSENGFIARRQTDGGPPMRFDWVTCLEELHTLHRDTQCSLPLSTVRLFTAKPRYVYKHVSVDDGFRMPVSATLTLLDTYMIIRSKALPKLGQHSKPPRTCDVIPLSDINFVSDHVSRLYIQRYSSGDVLFVNTLNCQDLEHRVHCLRLEHGNYAYGLYWPVSRSQIKPVFVGMALFYRTSSDISLRFAADSLLRAAGIIKDVMQPVFIPPSLPKVDIPAPFRTPALLTAMSITSCLGRQHLMYTSVDQLFETMDVQDLPRTLRLGLMLWMIHPELRTVLGQSLLSVRTQRAAKNELFLDACVDLTPMALSPVLGSIQDVIIAAAIPMLHDLMVQRLRKKFVTPRTPGLLHEVHALIALHAVQCLVPDTPIRTYVPDIMCIVLLFHYDPLPTFHTLSFMTLMHLLVVWPSPTLATLVRDKFKSSLSPVALVELVNTIVFTLAPNPEQHSQWSLAIESQIQSIAFASGAVSQLHALRILGYLSNPSQFIMHKLGSVIIDSFPHVPATVDAATECLSHVFLPSYAPMLFWAGILLITSGIYGGGLRLSIAALDILGSTAYTSLMHTRQQFMRDAMAFDAALGVSFERDFSFACASVLRGPLWNGLGTIPDEARGLAERLNMLLPPEATASEDAAASGLSLLLYLFDPNNTDAEDVPAQYRLLKDQSESSHNNKILSAALARSFLPRATDAQVHAMLPLLSEADSYSLRRFNSSLTSSNGGNGDTNNSISPLSRLGFSGLNFDSGFGQTIAECRSWLEHIVQRWSL